MGRAVRPGPTRAFLSLNVLLASAEKRGMRKQLPAMLVLAAALGCGTPGEQQLAQSASTPAPETPAAGASAPAGTNAATPGTETQSQAAPRGSAHAAAAPPAPAMKAMDVPSGT